MNWQVYRDCDARKLRKVVIELWGPDGIVDRRRMFALFGGKWFQKRLARKQAKMLKLSAAFTMAKSYSEYEQA